MGPKGQRCLTRQYATIYVQTYIGKMIANISENKSKLKELGKVGIISLPDERPGAYLKREK